MGDFFCKICDAKFDSQRGLSYHITQTHKIDLREYALEFLGVTGKCAHCGKPTSFRGLGQLFMSHCSRSCVNFSRDYTKMKSSLRSKLTEKEIESLQSLYDKGTSIRDISIMFGVDHKTIRPLISTCSPTEMAKKRCKKIKEDFLFNNESKIRFAHKKYMSGIWNISECSSYVGCASSCMKGHFKSFGLEIKSLSDSYRISKKLKSVSQSRVKKFNVEEAYKDHLSGMPINLLEEKYKISQSVIGRVFKREGLEVKFFFKSSKEIKFEEEISKWGIKYESRTRKIIKPFELDFYFPDHKLAVEINGRFFHSAFASDKNKTTQKFKLCKSLGIKLITVWEDDSNLISLSRLKSILGIQFNKVHARKCEVTQDRKEIMKFIDNNHLHGNVSSSYYFGLEHRGELVAAISYRKHKEGIEIARFVSKVNTQVIGGFQKLLKASINKLKDDGYTSIITYADMNWTATHDDSVYYKSGFEYVGETGCQLFYAYGKNTYSRHKFQKHKICKKFPDYDGTLSANEFLRKKGVFPLYKLGNYKFKLDI